MSRVYCIAPLFRWTGLILAAALLHYSTGHRALAASPGEPPELPTEEEEEGLDVLTRGPVHDAFAEPVARDPEEGVIVEKEPPPPIEEVPPEAKPEGDDVVWIPGYWFWDDEASDFVWVSGVWRRAPPDRRWVPGYWQEVDGGHQWVPGFWAAEEAREVEYVEPPPESLEVGPSVPASSDDEFWIPGSWVVTGETYRWRPGFWHTFRTGWTWVPARYVWTPRGCIFVNGYWDYPLARRGCLFAPVRFHRPLYRRAGFVYRPRHWIGYESLLLHLFIRPSYHHYYFGDYYAGGYRQHYRPCVDYFTRYRGFSPVYTYYHHHYLRLGINYVSRVRSWHSYYVRHPHLRPHHTWFAQQRWLRGHGAGLDRHRLTYGTLGRDLHRVGHLGGHGWKRVALGASELAQYRSHSRHLRQLAEVRKRAELPDVAAAGALRRSKPGGPARRRASLELPVSEMLAKARARQPGPENSAKADLKPNLADRRQPPRPGDRPAPRRGNARRGNDRGNDGRLRGPRPETPLAGDSADKTKRPGLADRRRGPRKGDDQKVRQWFKDARRGPGHEVDRPRPGGASDTSSSKVKQPGLADRRPGIDKGDDAARRRWFGDSRRTPAHEVDRPVVRGQSPSARRPGSRVAPERSSGARRPSTPAQSESKSRGVLERLRSGLSPGNSSSGAGSKPRHEVDRPSPRSPNPAAGRTIRRPEVGTPSGSRRPSLPAVRPQRSSPPGRSAPARSITPARKPRVQSPTSGRPAVRLSPRSSGSQRALTGPRPSSAVRRSPSPSASPSARPRSAPRSISPPRRSASPRPSVPSGRSSRSFSPTRRSPSAAGRSAGRGSAGRGLSSLRSSGSPRPSASRRPSPSRSLGSGRSAAARAGRSIGRSSGGRGRGPSRPGRGGRR